jgi:hypothetical protein
MITRGNILAPIERFGGETTHSGGLGMPTPVRRVGSGRVDLERLAQTELVGADGAVHRLGDYWEDRPVILVFLRHFG